MSLLKTGVATLILLLPATTFSYIATEEIQKAQARSAVVTLIDQELDTFNITEPFDRQRLHDIAYCESIDTQFLLDGTLYRGEIDERDIGIYQINEHYHPYDKALNMGFDYYTSRGNIDYAIQVYKWQGSKPWRASSLCWSRSPATW